MHLILFTFLFLYFTLLYFTFRSCATTLLHVCTVHTITYNSLLLGLESLKPRERKVPERQKNENL